MQGRGYSHAWNDDSWGGNGIAQPQRNGWRGRGHNLHQNGEGKKGRFAGGRGNGRGQPPVSQEAQQDDYVPPARANPNSRTTSTTLSQITTERFQDLPISEPAKQAMANVLNYEFMTAVQAKTIRVSLSGTDLLAKAKTGTGKTLAFLIPSMELVLRLPPQQRKGNVSVLVISPTRELASQIGAEAGQLMTYMTALSYMVVFGGTKIGLDLQGFNKRIPDLLVATPGRLNDHLQNNNLSRNTRNLRCLIFDEADQLLEMGFRPEITKMLSMLPPTESRQTLLFSATMPKDVMTIAHLALRQQDFVHVDCVGQEVDTHQHVPQSYTIHPLHTQFAELMQIINEGMKEDDQYKMLVFFTTARVTQLFAELFNKSGYGVLEMHSRKTQSVRTRTSDRFRDSTRVIMFTSDVTARGMDYPDVTKVIQVGLPSDKAQYVHRLGRTARAGKSGNGVLLLADYESFFLRNLKDQDLEERPTTAPATLQVHQQVIDRSLSSMPYSSLAAAYQAWLGFYNSNLKKLQWSRERVVEEANNWIVMCCHLTEPPSLQAKTVAKMQLKGVPGLNIESGGRKGGGEGGKGGGRKGGKGSMPNLGDGGGKGGKQGNGFSGGNGRGGWGGGRW